MTKAWLQMSELSSMMPIGTLNSVFVTVCVNSYVKTRNVLLLVVASLCVFGTMLCVAGIMETIY